MSFKLLAIRPLKGCGFLKNLNINDFYTFYNDYKFVINTENNLITINHNATVPLDLYYDDINNKINISAIVGKNGSGKSSIVELLYAAIYNYSVKKGMIYNELKDSDDNDFSIDEFKIIDNVIQRKEFNIDLINSIDDSIEVLSKLKKYIKSSLPVVDDSLEYLDINVQIYYVFGDLPRMLHVKGEKIDFYCFEKKTPFQFTLNVNAKQDINEDQNDVESFFYSIVNNYSLYGLNSNEIGDWISYIFHKNDEYQTPIVINPMRTDGNIEINTENDLSKSRLLSNILTFVPKNENLNNSFRCLVQDKIANNLILNLKLKKYLNKNEELEFKYYESYKEKFFLNILNSFKSHEFENDIQEIELFQRLQENSIIDKFTIEYIFRKIEKIAKTYKIGKDDYKGKFSYDNFHVITDFIIQLKDKQTHITFKLRQAINFFKYYRNYKSFTDLANFELNPNDVVNISIQDLSDDINSQIIKLTKLYSDTQSFVTGDGKSGFFKPQPLSLINFIPPSIFEIDIEFENNMGSFNFLSSGEKQSIYSINTILYHIVNIESIHSNSSSLIEYRFVNLILDEIELYFHPEMQRNFIKNLLDKIKRIRTINIDLNIIFITHSPFILSDIPHQNILFLEVKKLLDEKGNPILDTDGNEKVVSLPQRREQTFASNIHELLTDGFFMESTKGAFSISKINNFLEYYKKWYCSINGTDEYNICKTEFKEKKNYFEKLILLIGEDYVRKILDNHLEELCKHFEISIEKELSITELEERKNLLEIELKEIQKKIKNDKN